VEAEGFEANELGAPWRILIVDDESDFVETLADILEPRGYSIQRAGSVSEARQAFRTFCPDVALLDIRLGRGTGIDVLSELRKACPHALCVVMTAYATVETAIEALQEGAYDYLRKPLSAPDLMKTLERCFEKLCLEREKQLAEGALRGSKERLRTMVEASKDAMIVLERDGRISLFNPAAEAMFGRRAGSMTAPNAWLSLLPQRNHEASRAYVEAYFNGTLPPELGDEPRRITACRRDGTMFPAEVSLSLGRHQENRFLFAVLRDVTDRERLEEQLRQAQKMEAVGQLAGGIAHDFNNLLQVILGNTQFVMTDLPSGAPMLEDLQEVYDAGQRAASLTRQLLALSRKQILQPEDVNLNDVVADVMKMLRRVIGEHIDLHVIPDRKVPKVHADPGQLQQVLINLVVNARDAMPEGGRMTIRIRSRVLDQTSAREYPDARPGKYTVIEVADTGCGMDSGTLDHVFDPFFTTKEVGKGTGLGLATVYGVVRQHNGFVHAWSRPGEGARFEVYLPAAAAAKADVSQEAPAKAPGGSETILIAEDDAPVRHVASRILAQGGYTVITAADGREALDLFTKQADEIDLVILDVVMPKLSGPAVREQLKAIRDNVPVVYTSGYSDDVFGSLEDAAGTPQVLQKPYEPGELLARVRDVLDV